MRGPYPKEIKNRAKKLRSQGWSVLQIMRELDVAKSTAASWVRTVPLSAENKKRLYTRTIYNLTYGPKSQRIRRQKEIKKILSSAKKEIALPLNMDAYRLCGAMLYWAEGSKNKGFEFTNSDPLCILFMVCWLQQVIGMRPNTLIARLNIHRGQDEAAMKSFWSDLTKIPLRNFRKTFIKPSNKKVKKNTLYYGTIKICAGPGAADLRYRIFGWIDSATRSVGARVAKNKKKWYALRNYKRP